MAQSLLPVTLPSLLLKGQGCQRSCVQAACEESLTSTAIPSVVVNPVVSSSPGSGVPQPSYLANSVVLTLFAVQAAWATWPLKPV